MPLGPPVPGLPLALGSPVGEPPVALVGAAVRVAGLVFGGEAGRGVGAGVGFGVGAGLAVGAGRSGISGISGRGVKSVRSGISGGVGRVSSGANGTGVSEVSPVGDSDVGADGGWGVGVKSSVRRTVSSLVESSGGLAVGRICEVLGITKPMVPKWATLSQMARVPICRA